MTIVIQVLVKVIEVDLVEEEVETSHLLVVLVDGLEDVLLVTGHRMVYAVVEEVPTIQDRTHRIHKVVTQVQLVDNIKVTDILLSLIHI